MCLLVLTYEDGGCLVSLIVHLVFYVLTGDKRLLF